ncbi:putative toxin-antitoxin system toxin component, PIN family [Mesoaciditoga lauensis]|uniref:putative toxin-antitoxin system toxin component, PIN family n=1 Tax=Mesoaciditoga lauensis TaxID=1495039 RepID=UPI000567DD03|nr:putative toxin-antitoxin system toxin component, PIN family [Mesoaciditoga lauensis]
MKIMIDTNVLISALAFPNSTPAKAVEKIIQDGHEVALCDQIVSELIKVVELKFPTKMHVLKDFLENFNYTLFRTPKVLNGSEYPVVRDESDLPILVCAIDNSIEILVSGDKDLLSIQNCERLKILSPAEVLQKL